MSTGHRYPNLFIVGAQRSGTTSLYEYLRVHPQVFMSPQKETHFFSQDGTQLDDDLVVRSEGEYLKLFTGAGSARVIGEASPSYLWHPEAAQRIHARQPKAKIVAILRDPVARAYSQFRMDLGDGLPDTSFGGLVEREHRFGPKVYGTGHLYVELGQYTQQVQRYLDVFSPAQVLVLAFRDLRTKPESVLARLAAFLRIDAARFPKGLIGTVHNRVHAPRNALVKKLLGHRAVRQRYRRTVPGSLRRVVRDYVFAPGPEPGIDRVAARYLRSVYERDARALEQLCGEPLSGLV